MAFPPKLVTPLLGNTVLFMKSTYTLEDKTIYSPYTTVEFRKESTDEGNTVVLYLCGEVETDLKETALVIMNNVCTLTGAPNARIRPVNIIPNNIPTGEREWEMAH